MIASIAVVRQLFGRHAANRRMLPGLFFPSVLF
jgi:hypothetical protein